MTIFTDAQVALLAATQITSDDFRGNEEIVMKDASKFLVWLKENS